MQVIEAAKLLGAYAGSECRKPGCKERLQKPRNSVKDIKFATAPIHTNACDYNIRVCPVLSYQAQLLPLDPTHFQLARIALHAVFRAPYNLS